MRKYLIVSAVILFFSTAVALKKNPKPYAFPNPYNIVDGRKLTIHVPFKKNSLITVDVYSQSGRFIKRISNKKLSSISNSFKWDGKDDENMRVKSGLYFIHITQKINKLTYKDVFKLAVY